MSSPFTDFKDIDLNPALADANLEFLSRASFGRPVALKIRAE